MKGKQLDPESESFRKVDSAIAEYGSRFYRLAFSLSGSREEAEDIVMEAFVAAYKNHMRINDPEAIVAWLYRVVLNQVRMHRRRQRVSVSPISEADHVSTPIPTDYIALSQALASLSPKQREAVVLIKGEGLSFQEAAALLKRPVGTVASHVRQGMAILRREFFPTEAEICSIRGWKHELP